MERIARHREGPLQFRPLSLLLLLLLATADDGSGGGGGGTACSFLTFATAAAVVFRILHFH